MRRVISLWLPRFATDRLRQQRQDGRAARADDARPLVTVVAVGGLALVAAVDAAAAATGLAPGLPLADARALVPGLRVRPADPAGDAAALARLADWCGRYTPWTAVETGDAGNGAGIWLDATGCAHLFGGEAALLADLVARLGRLGHGARAAFADTPGAAWAVARFMTESGDGLVVAPGGARAALAPLPVAALRLPPAAAEGLARLGLGRVGDLYPLPRAALVRRFGTAPALRLDQALGRADEPISPRAPVAPHRAALAFAEPVIHGDGLAAGLGRLLAALCRRLDAEQLGARRLELTLYRVDGSLARAAVGTGRPNRDSHALARLFADRLDRLDPGFGVVAMALAAARVEPLTALQLVLAGDSAARDGEIAPLIDRLGNRLGFDRVVRFAARESHLPERAVRRLPAAAEPAAPAVWRLVPPRPLRLFVRPERVEATALLPDHPPALFRWRARLHRVARAEGPERIAAEWWRADGPARDYFRVEDEAGARFWLYREGPVAWFLHGLFG